MAKRPAKGEETFRIQDLDETSDRGPKEGLGKNLGLKTPGKRRKGKAARNAQWQKFNSNVDSGGILPRGKGYGGSVNILMKVLYRDMFWIVPPRFRNRVEFVRVEQLDAGYEKVESIGWFYEAPVR